MQTSFPLRIDSLAFGGDGVGRHEGVVVFVPGTTPGDLVEAKVLEKSRNFLRAQATRIIEPGPSRIAPPCPTYPACGGCQWQHIDYPTQFAAKSAIVERALHRFEPAEIRLHPAPSPFRYRRRARLSFRTDQDTHLGFLARQSDQVIDTSSCQQLVPELEAMLMPLREQLRLFGPGRGEVELLASASGQVLAAVNLKRPPKNGLSAFAASPLAGVVGLFATDGAESFTWGDATITLDLRGLRASARSFTQANAGQDVVLREVVLRTLQTLNVRTVLEFHAGIGNFTLDLATAGYGVTAVESEPIAVDLLRQNLSAFNTSCISADAEAFNWTEKPDCILLDPPREGAPQLCQRIAASKVRHVIYVSCDPMTLARDVATLTAARFRLRAVDIIDMMPQTYHIETACFLSRN